MKKILLTFLLCLPFLATAQIQTPPRNPQACADELPYGVPLIKNERSVFICRKAYFLQHDNAAKIPIWVAYVLTPQETLGCEKRTNYFRPDYSLPKGERAELKDYKNSGYDTGHIANSADMSWDRDVEIESFILSNMTPQLPGFNRGIWKKLEEQIRVWAYSRHHNILIYAGPIYAIDDKSIGASNVIVPYAFYKIIVDTSTNEVMVFRFNHEASDSPLNEFLISLSFLQKETGILFPLPKNAIFSKEIWQNSAKSVTSVKKSVCSIQK